MATKTLHFPSARHLHQLYAGREDNLAFIEKHLEARMREAQRATRLKKLEDDDLRDVVSKASKRLERTYEALRGLHKREGQPDFAPEAHLRSGQGPAIRGSREGQPS